ncbi:hypothetical protein ACQPZ2_28850 [Nocardia pseudovaccinii]|uniref:hypothetical protein n=1 Tax=Nocardia pseudovaccinii TaxID=189540 RepID=UPI003D90EDF0
MRGLALSTVRAYQLAIRSFLAYVCEPLYGWDVECEKRFGTHPIQISHDWNSAKHIQDVEGRPQRRALTRVELQLLFDAADEMVEEIRRHGRKGAVAAFRDAALLKTAYAFGLRRQEVVRLEVHDFGRNPKATEFGDFGVCYVRFGKGSYGSSAGSTRPRTARRWPPTSNGTTATGSSGNSTTATYVPLPGALPEIRRRQHGISSDGCGREDSPWPNALSATSTTGSLPVRRRACWPASS